MPKYDPLRDYLGKQTVSEVVLSFAQIEKLVGPLPRSSARVDFWETARKPIQKSPVIRAAREAGYECFLIKGPINKVRFKKPR